MYTFIINQNEYNLDEKELKILKEASSYYNAHNYFFALHELHNIFYSNILKRIEIYNAEYFLLELKSKEILQVDKSNILKKWENFDIKDILYVSKKLKIINFTTYHLFLSFNEYKVNTLTTDIVSKEYLISYFNILKEELFKYKPLKKDIQNHDMKRRKSDIMKRRKQDRINRRKEDRINNELNDKETIIQDSKKLNPVIFKNFIIDDDKETDSNSIYV